jgi:NTP pyrophosphatase (non-canonical NTP hydrolase)
MIEEMAELTVAINKLKRSEHFVAQKKEGVMENLFEELADVKLCLEQLEWIFGEDKVNATMEVKIQKFLKQLNE